MLGEFEGGLVSVGEADDHAGGAADGLEVGVEGGQEQVVGLFHAADGSLGDAQPSGEFDLGEFGGLAEGRESHGVGAVRLGHLGADLGDLGGDVGPLGQLVDAVVTAGELNFLAHGSFPSAAARRRPSPRRVPPRLRRKRPRSPSGRIRPGRSRLPRRWGTSR
jgi:hypothetical protein